jgi:hypothetical protein
LSKFPTAKVPTTEILYSHIWFKRELKSDPSRRSYDYVRLVIAELLHHAKKDGMYGDDDLDNAVKGLMTPEAWEAAIAEKKKNQLADGTIGHRYINEFCTFSPTEDIGK